MGARGLWQENYSYPPYGTQTTVTPNIARCCCQIQTIQFKVPKTPPQNTMLRGRCGSWVAYPCFSKWVNSWSNYVLSWLKAAFGFQTQSFPNLQYMLMEGTEFITFSGSTYKYIKTQYLRHHHFSESITGIHLTWMHYLATFYNVS